MKRHRQLLAALSVALFYLWTQDASAQQAHSFEQLQVIVKPGDNIYVTDADGKVNRGRVTALSNSSLKVQSNGLIRDYSESNIFEIKQWRHDSLKNGALTGAGVAVGLTLTAAALLCDDDCNGGEAVAFTLLYAGIGAGIGVGIDALIPSKQTIYHGTVRNSFARIRIKPVFDRSRKGVAVAVRF